MAQYLPIYLPVNGDTVYVSTLSLGTHRDKALVDSYTLRLYI